MPQVTFIVSTMYKREEMWEGNELKVKEDTKIVYPKDVKQYLEAGYKEIKKEQVSRRFSLDEIERYIHGKQVKKVVEPKSPQQVAYESDCEYIKSCSDDELQEFIKQNDIDLILGMYPKTTDKITAVLLELKKMFENGAYDGSMFVQTPDDIEEDEPEAPTQDELTADELKSMLKGKTVKELEAWCDEEGLNIDLAEFKLKDDKIDAIIVALSN